MVKNVGNVKPKQEIINKKNLLAHPVTFSRHIDGNLINRGFHNNNNMFPTPFSK